jgi:hypothetical protein
MKQFFRGVKEKIKRFNWGNILLILISTIIGFIIFSRIIINKITFENASTLTSNILTINGIFSAILITYLFTRITWTKDRKLETYNEA